MSAVAWFRAPVRLHFLGRVVLLAGFLWLAGRHWHPYYGFTRFLQMDELALATTLPELRTAPIYQFDSGYDGHYYAQLAARPAVRDPALTGGIDNVPYRARRILLSWTAWVVGGGDPVAAVRAYAWLNLMVWAGLAVLLWRIFPAAGWRETLAWGGVMFSAGALHSVRLALTDLLALLLVAAAVVQAERGRPGRAAAWLGLGALARETALLGAIALLPPGKAAFSVWRRTAGWLVLAVLPLAAWLLYLRMVWGGGVPGWANFTLPVAGWVEKWGEIWFRLRTEPDRYLTLTTLCAHLALSGQVLYLALKPAPHDRWWRLGVVYGGLMLLLGTAVWDGHPGAATRILLPLGLAFNVLAVRGRAAPAWLVLGNLSVLSGVLALWAVPRDAHELAAGRTGAGAYVVHTDGRWHPAEHGRDRTWAWSAAEGRLNFEFNPRADGSRKIALAVRGITSRPLEIRQAGRVLWRGEISERLQWIDLPPVAISGGRAELELRSGAAPVREGEAAVGRALGFAVYGVRVE
jgi:hypothetical protein